MDYIDCMDYLDCIDYTNYTYYTNYKNYINSFFFEKWKSYRNYRSYKDYIDYINYTDHMNYTNYRHYRDYVDDTDFKKWLKLQKLRKLLQWIGRSALQLCRGSEVTQVTLLSCNYFASFHKDTVTSYIITFITRGEFFFKRQNFGTQQFWHLITSLHTLQKKLYFFWGSR